MEAVSDLLRPPAGDVPGRGLHMIETIPRGVKRVPAGQADFMGSGAEETRTPDFLLAKEALYQLSYGP